MCLRHRQKSNSDAFLEESFAPHAHEEIGDSEGDADEVAKDVVKLDKHLHITLTDLHQFGPTPHCARCDDLQQGKCKTKQLHDDECGLRLYLAYQPNEHPKWQEVKHLFEPEKSFHQSQIDGEGAPTTQSRMILTLNYSRIHCHMLLETREETSVWMKS